MILLVYVILRAFAVWLFCPDLDNCDGQAADADKTPIIGCQAYVPHMGGPAQMDRAGDAGDVSILHGSDMIGVQLDPKAAVFLGVCGQHRSDAAKRFCQRGRRAAMQNAVRLVGAGVDRHARLDKILTHGGELHAGRFHQCAGNAGIQRGKVDGAKFRRDGHGKIIGQPLVLTSHRRLPTVRRMKIAIIMPRRMNFSPKSATSIDLCVHDYVLASKYRDAVTIYAMPVDAPYADMSVKFFSDQADLLRQLDNDKPDLIFAQQHLPTATKLAARYRHTPVLMQAHNFQKPPRNFFKRWYKTIFYRRLAGLVMVSHALVNGFRATYPGLSLPLFAAPNGLDLSVWQPQAQRVQEVLFVGRLVDEKGVFETAGAVAKLLPSYPGWRARFIVSTKDNISGNRERLEQLVAPLGDQAIVDYDRPFAEVKGAMERAEIAVVPSIYQEPFGRTAIEAFAGGAALVSSTRGGLDEVVGDCAIRLDGEITPDTIAAALKILLDDPDRRGKLARAGTARVAANFTIGNNAAAIDAAIDMLIAKA